MDSQETFDKFMRHLAAKKVVFKTLTTRQYPCVKERLLLSPQSDHVFIDEDVPYTVVATTWLWQPCCDIEIDPASLHNVRCGEKEEDWLAAILMEHDNCRGARYICCPAMMYIKQVDTYPEFRVPFLTQYSTSQGREAAIKETLSRLKLALQEESSGKPLLRHQRFYIKMCDKMGRLSHDEDYCCKEQPANTNVMQNQMQWAQTNMPSLATDENYLTYYVKEVLFAGDPSLITKCEDFHATKRTIKDLIRRALLKDGFSSLVQEDIASFVNELHEKVPETSHRFHTYQQRDVQRESDQQSTELDCNVLETIASECRDSLLLCAHVDFVTNLMHKHSEIVICIEVALRGTGYALPVFLLCFKTPRYHAMVGTFLVHFEMADCMAEALDLFKARDLNTAVTKFWIVEHSEAEISALSSVFPGSRPLLCDFHRHESWSEWQPKALSDTGDVRFVKEMLQKVACSKNDDERRSAVEMLEQSPHWQRNKRLQGYVCQKWLLVIEILAERQGRAFCFSNLISDSGTESRKVQSFLAKHCRSHHARGLVRVFAKKFSPDNMVQALQASASSVPQYPPLHHGALPQYPHCKPTNDTKHIVEGLASAAPCRKSDIIRRDKEEGTFLIPSTNQSCRFEKVNLNIASCTSSKFIQTEVPCEHIAEVFSHSESRDISRTPAAYRNEPAAQANADCVLQQMTSTAPEREVLQKVEPNQPHVAGIDNIDCLLQTVNDASVFVKVKLSAPQMTGHGTTDCMSLGISSNAPVTEACIQAEPNEPNMTAHEDADFVMQETVSEASEGVFIKLEPNDGHVADHADTECMSQSITSTASQMAASIKAEPKMILVAAHEDADFMLQEPINEASVMEPCMKAKPKEPGMTAHKGGDCMSIGKVSEMEVCIKVEPKETHEAVLGYADYMLQAMTSTTSEKAASVKAETNETHMIAHENAGFVMQDKMSNASEMEVFIKVEPNEAETVSEASEMETCFEVEPNEIGVANPEGTDYMSPIAGSKASDIEACIKVEPSEPHTTGYDDASSILQETVSNTREVKFFVEGEPRVMFHEIAGCALQERVSEISEMDPRVSFGPSGSLLKVREDADYLLLKTVSNASVCIEAKQSVLHITAHEDSDCAVQERTFKSQETKDCLKAEQDLEPSELPAETCSRYLKQGDPKQSMLHIKSQIKARMEEVDSLLCCIQDTALLQQVVDKVNQAAALVERNVAGCSGACNGRSTAQRCIGAKRKRATSTELTKKKKDIS